MRDHLHWAAIVLERDRNRLYGQRLELPAPIPEFSGSAIVMDRYVLGEDKKGEFIFCRTCSTSSRNAGDIEHLYCAQCKQFHEDP